MSFKPLHYSVYKVEDDQGSHPMSTSSLYMHMHMHMLMHACTYIPSIYTGKSILAVSHIREFSCKTSQCHTALDTSNLSISRQARKWSDVVMLRSRAKFSMTQDSLKGDSCGMDFEYTLSSGPTLVVPT